MKFETLQFRSNWLVDPSSGEYHAHLKSPTGIAADPTLTAHGVDQAKELAAHLIKLDPPIERIFSSPYYRCLQTVQPFVDILASSDKPELATVLGETGLSEWYGSAPFEHPTSASPQMLKGFFPAFDIDYEPAVTPSRTGETIAQLHDRVALALDAIIKRCNESGVRAILLCSHAATIIAIGRVLTGNMPENIETEDFNAFTCGLSVYTRKSNETASAYNPTQKPATAPSSGPFLGDSPIPQSMMWRDGKGVGGGWICKVNGDCSFLSGGEERGW